MESSPPPPPQQEESTLEGWRGSPSIGMFQKSAAPECSVRMF